MTSSQSDYEQLRHQKIPDVTANMEMIAEQTEEEFRSSVVMYGAKVNFRKINEEKVLSEEAIPSNNNSFSLK